MGRAPLPRARHSSQDMASIHPHAGALLPAALSLLLALFSAAPLLAAAPLHLPGAAASSGGGEGEAVLGQRGRRAMRGELPGRRRGDGRCEGAGVGGRVLKEEALVPGWGLVPVSWPMHGPWNFSTRPTYNGSKYLRHNLDRCRKRPHCAQHTPDHECTDILLQAAVSSRHRRTAFRVAMWSTTPPAQGAQRRRLQGSEGSSLAAASSGATSLPLRPSDSTQESAMRENADGRHVEQGHSGHERVEQGAPLLWVTYLTVCSRQADRLARQVSAAGIPLAVLGVGTVWFPGFLGYRLRMLHAFLTSVPEDTLLIFSDSGTAMPVPATNPAGIIQRYNDLVALYEGPRIFFLASQALGPLKWLGDRFPDPRDVLGDRCTGCTSKFLDAGIFVGPAGLIVRLLGVIYQGDCWDDHALFSLALLDPIVWWQDAATGALQVASTRQGPGTGRGSTGSQDEGGIPAGAKKLVGLDYTCTLLQSLHHTKLSHIELRTSTGSVTFRPTNEKPLLLHQRGEEGSGIPLEHFSCAFGIEEDGDKICNRESPLDG